jgi:hypothetical protein
LKFLYKIHSNYDGFTPRRIPDRLKNGRFLKLGWSRYLDAVDKGAECWIYFYGRHSFAAGVYVKGYVTTIDREAGEVTLRVRESNFDRPLVDHEDNARIAEVVAPRYRQVFLWPDQWDAVPECTVASCGDRLCGNCRTWKSLPRIDLAQYRAPPRVAASLVAPAYWVIPNRCYLYAERKAPSASATRMTHRFDDFKIGEKRYAYPFARAMFEVLKSAGALEFDAIIPIPLSPDKAQAGEVHRTLILAQEVGRLLGSPVREYLTLNTPISKRRMLAAGHTAAQFRRAY